MKREVSFMQNRKLYIETVQTDMESGRNTYTTSGTYSKLREMTALDTELIQTIKENIDKICNSFSENLMADELEVEFSFCVTGEGNICILSGSSSMGIKVKMVWKK